MLGNDRGNEGRSEEDADDVRLMRLIGRGNTIALQELIEKHQALVAGTVARMLGSNSDVEDIAQQVFIRGVTPMFHSNRNRARRIPR